MYRKLLNENNKKVEDKFHYIYQEEPLGTGHAIMCCKNYLNKLNEKINKCIVLSGDVPCIKFNTLNKLLNNTNDNNILIAYTNEPHGYGRIKVDNNKFSKIVEEKDCSEGEKKIKIINTGIYCFKINILLNYLDQINNNNNQKEYYLTQLFEILVNNNINIGMTFVKDLHEVMGVNTNDQLAALEIQYQEINKITI